MLTVWLAELLFTWGTIKVTKAVVGSTVKGKLDKRRTQKNFLANKKMEEKYNATVQNKEGKALNTEEFDTVDELNKWMGSFKEQQQEQAKFKIENEALQLSQENPVLEVKDFKESVQKFEVAIRKPKNLKGEIFTESEKATMENDVVNYLIKQKTSDSVQNELIFLEDLNKRVDLELHDVAKKGNFKLKELHDSKLLNSYKNDYEKKAGYYQKLIHLKYQVMENACEQNDIDHEIIKSARLLNQERYFNLDEPKISIKSFGKVKEFGLKENYNDNFETKSPRCMNLNELKDWRVQNDELIKETIAVGTRFKWSNKKIKGYAIEASNRINKDNKIDTSLSFKLSPEEYKKQQEQQKELTIKKQKNLSM